MVLKQEIPDSSVPSSMTSIPPESFDTTAMDLTGDSGYESPTNGPLRSSSSTPAAIGDLGRNARKLVDAVNQLSEYGVEASGLPLPKLVVVGDQSSGKSSLIEAISEIKVPRAAGTCTRCPLKINLKQAETSSWEVVLIKTHYWVPPQRKGTNEWRNLKVPETIARLPVGYDQVENALWRAQEAVLRPSQDQASILQGSEQHMEGKDVQFSPNMIELNVRGPTCQDLTLYDLPGIINSTADGREDLPQLVKELARGYIQSPNTTVIVALPMNADMETSTTADLVKKWGATNRSVGVLTKPDMLPSGDDLESWSAIMRGSKWGLEYGYYVTKQPNSAELKQRITHIDARKNEMSFFNQPPWTSTFAPHRQNFGTSALQVKLATLLANEIATFLPELYRNIRQRAHQVSEELQKYPPPPPSPYGAVLRIVEHLRSDLDHLLLGDVPGDVPYSNKLVREWRAHIQDLFSGLKSKQPLTVVNTGTENHWKKASQIITIDDDDEPESSSSRYTVPVMTPTPGNKRAGSTVSSQESPTKRARTQATPGAVGPSTVAKFQLKEVRAIVSDFVASHVPSDTDPRAEDHIIMQSTKYWEEPVKDYLSSVYRAVERHLLECIRSRTMAWRNTALPQTVENTVQECFDTIFTTHEQACIKTLRAEQLRPYTCNSDALKQYRAEQLSFLRDQRLKHRKRAYVNFQESSTGKAESSGQEREKKVAALNKADLISMGEDPHDAELQVMARVRGYHQLAASSLADSLGKKSQLEVFEEVREQLQSAVPRGLGVDGDDAACVENSRKLLTEDPEREARRQELAAEQEKLQKAISLLDSLKRA